MKERTIKKPYLVLSVLLIAMSTLSESLEEQLEDFYYSFCKDQSDIIEAIVIARFEEVPLSQLIEGARANTENTEAGAIMEKLFINYAKKIYSFPKPKTHEEEINTIEILRDVFYKECLDRYLPDNDK